MQALFADIPSAIANTVEIARRCSLTLVLGKPQLPNFPVPDGMTMDEFFRSESFNGLEDRLTHPVSRSRQARGAAPALRGTAGVRDRHHPQDGLSGLLPHRGRLHQVGQAQRLPRGAGPRIGRGLAGGLRAQDHGPGPAGIQPAVRALPEPRARVHARLRRGLLPGQPRPRHRLCEAALRPRRRQPDRHLRYHGRARGHPRRGPRAGHELHLLRRHLQAHSQQAGSARHAQIPAQSEEGGRQVHLRHRGRAHAGRAHRKRRRRQDPDRNGPEARRHGLATSACTRAAW